MNRLVLLVMVVALGLADASADGLPSTVDLRDQRALERLKDSNPEHYERIQRIVAAVLDNPEEVTEIWLRTNFNAKHFSLQRGILRTSNPPKQLLQFTLDDVRYQMYLVRSDMVPGVFRP